MYPLILSLSMTNTDLSYNLWKDSFQILNLPWAIKVLVADT